MSSLTIAIKKGTVYNEVAQLTSYTGAKQEDAGKMYDRVFTTDDDRDMLESFWREACSVVTDGVRYFSPTISSPPNRDTVDLTEIFTVSLVMPSGFDTSLSASIQEAVYSYFKNSIASKWFDISKKEDAQLYQAKAEANWYSARSKLFFRKAPVRVVPTV